jgi:hypothetical protein
MIGISPLRVALQPGKFEFRPEEEQKNNRIMQVLLRHRRLSDSIGRNNPNPKVYHHAQRQIAGNGVSIPHPGMISWRLRTGGYF